MSGPDALLTSLLTLMRASAGSGGLAIPSDWSGLTFKGMPKPNGSPFFYGLHGASSEWAFASDAVDAPTLGVVISARCSVPPDTIGPELLYKATTGLIEKANDLAAWIGIKQHVWMNAANALLPDTTNGYILPATSVRISDPEEVKPDWFGDVEQKRDLQTQVRTAIYGVKINLTISGMYRRQYLETANG